MISHFVAVQYCYNYLINQIPVGLLLYSHIPTAIIALLFGGFVLLQARKLSAFTLFLVCVAFAGWCASDLISWFAFLGSGITMFSWTLVDVFAIVFFFFAYYFLHTFLTEKDLPLWQKIASIVILAPTFIWTFLGSNLTAYDANVCEATEDQWIVLYPFLVEGVFILLTLILAFVQYRRSTVRTDKRKVLLATTGVFLFLLFFFTATLSVNLLVNYDNVIDFAYNYGIYGLFGMPVLLGFLAYLIVRYHAFDLRVFGAQALIVALLVLLGSEFAFSASGVNQILIAVTLLLTFGAGTILVRSVRREIEQREQIQKLAGDLADTNKRQETLIHFIGHEVKASLTKDAGALASLVEGDFGALSDPGKQFAEHALAEARTGVDAVSNILKASNLKKGTVTYVKEPFDMKAVVAAAVEKARSTAEQKGLALTFTADDSQQYQVNGDKTQLNDHVLRNLIDNAVNYTPSGSINVSLKKENGKVIFAVKDTGVGITDEDKKLLFTEGGHGKESQKVNVHSTGYGLFIAKQITEAHGGTIHAESGGAGKGSTFIVELPG